VRVRKGHRLGWCLGRDKPVRPLPGHEGQWREVWAQHSERSGQTLDDLWFATTNGARSLFVTSVSDVLTRSQRARGAAQGARCAPVQWVWATEM